MTAGADLPWLAAAAEKDSRDGLSGLDKKVREMLARKSANLNPRGRGADLAKVMNHVPQVILCHKSECHGFILANLNRDFQLGSRQVGNHMSEIPVVVRPKRNQ